MRHTLLTGLAISCLAGPALAADFNWKCQTMWQPGTVNQRAFEQFATDVNEQSDGAIEIEVLPVGAIVPAGEMLDAMKVGILQCTNGGTGYYVGKDPAFGLLADLNAGYNTTDELTDWYYEGGGIELARDLYGEYGVYYVAPVLWGAESIPSKMPLRNIRDFEGIKMRSPEGMGAAIWSKLGVGVTTLPGTEVYTALERGKIEATDWGTLGMNDELGYGKIAPYAIYPGIHSMPAADIAVNIDNWNELPEDLQAVIRDAAKVANQNSLAMIREQDEKFAAERDPETLIEWGPEERRELRQVAREVWEEYAAKSEMAQRVYDSHIEYMTKQGLL